MHFSSDSFEAVAVVVVKSSLINYAPVNVNPRTPGREISRHLRGVFRYLTSEIGDFDDFSHQEQRGEWTGVFSTKVDWVEQDSTRFLLKTHFMKRVFFCFSNFDLHF